MSEAALGEDWGLTRRLRLDRTWGWVWNNCRCGIVCKSPPNLDGKRRTVERRVFPGYILVQMIMDEDSWYVVRNTPGVTGFVGMGNTPTPLRPEEVSQIVKRMEAEAPTIKVSFKEGQKIRIIDGPFNDFIGTVAEIDVDKGKVRALVNFFGRDTPVELDFLQVEKA